MTVGFWKDWPRVTYRREVRAATYGHSVTSQRFACIARRPHGHRTRLGALLCCFWEAAGR